MLLQLFFYAQVNQRYVLITGYTHDVGAAWRNLIVSDLKHLVCVVTKILFVFDLDKTDLRFVFVACPRYLYFFLPIRAEASLDIRTRIFLEVWVIKIEGEARR